MPKTIGWRSIDCRYSFWADGFWDNAAELGRDDHGFGKQGAQFATFAPGEGVDQADEIRGADRHALAAGGGKKAKKTPRHRPRRGRGYDLEPLLPGDQLDSEGAFSMAEVFLAIGVKLAQMPRACEMNRFGRHRRFGHGQAWELAADFPAES